MARKKSSEQNHATSHPTGSRRQQLAAQNAQADRDQKIRRRVRLTLVIAVVAAVLFGGIWIGTAMSSRPSAGAAAAEDGGIITIGQEAAPVRLEVYQDFMCPYCGRFERANGTDLAQLVDAGKVRLEIHPMSFLDSASNGTEYSTRAANAFVTVAKAAPERALAFNAGLYANQPAENSKGLSDDQISQIALGVGVDKAVVDSFTAMKYEKWVKDGTQADFKAGITGTPTVKINGETFSGDLYSAGPLKAAIEAAAHD